MNITGKKVMIFAKEFDGKIHYRAGLSTKTKDGSYDKAYIDVRFPNGVEPPKGEKAKINITKGFLTFYNIRKEDKITHTLFYIVIQEYEEITEEKPEEQEVYVVKNITEEQLDMPMDLPF